MKFLYATDLHGAEDKYNALFDFAIGHDIHLIHLGADLLPKGPDMLGMQKSFVNGFLKRFYKKCKDINIVLIGFFGNDDIYTRKKYFKEYGTLLDETPYSFEGYEFKAYPYVMDYPFGLKTACKLDSSDWIYSEDNYLGPPCDFTERGYTKIVNIKEYFRKKGTIEEDLKNLTATDKTIMAMHMPPCGLNMDVCLDGRRVGSKAIYGWIVREQPLLTLHGHIHESYKHSWKDYVGNTLVIQPGQEYRRTNAVFVEIENHKIDTHFLTL